LTCFLDVIISSTITYRMLSRDINLSPWLTFYKPKKEP
jgi:hypothetical protein